MRITEQHGFTYLWVLMTVAFLGFGSVVAAEIHSTSLRRDQEAELLALGRQFQRALLSYYNVPTERGNEYPLALDNLLEDRRGGALRRHLRKLFVDPVTAKSEWGLVRVGGRVVGIHSLSSAQPLKQGGFEPDMLHLEGRHQLSEWVFMNQATVGQ